LGDQLRAIETSAGSGATDAAADAAALDGAVAAGADDCDDEDPAAESLAVAELQALSRRVRDARPARVGIRRCRANERDMDGPYREVRCE
jgi:hypothetical protein